MLFSFRPTHTLTIIRPIVTVFRAIFVLFCPVGSVFRFFRTVLHPSLQSMSYSYGFCPMFTGFHYICIYAFSPIHTVFCPICFKSYSYIFLGPVPYICPIRSIRTVYRAFCKVFVLIFRNIRTVFRSTCTVLHPIGLCPIRTVFALHLQFFVSFVWFSAYLYGFSSHSCCFSFYSYGFTSF